MRSRFCCYAPWLGMFALMVGCHAPSKQSMLDVVDASMSNIRCEGGCVGAPPPPANADVSHVPVAFPVMPDPRTPLPGAPRWELGLEEALRVALGNSEVVRALPGATTPITGSALAGSSGGPTTVVGSGTSGPTQLGGTFNQGGGSNASGGAGGGRNPSNLVGGTGTGGGAAAGVGGSRYATIYDPAIAATRVESALGLFDASASASMFWERLENPPGQRFGGFINTIPRLDTAYFQTAIQKPFITGTVGRIAFNENYFFLPPGGPNQGVALPDPNPQYQSNLEFQLIQPLFRGAGSQVNRAPILIAGAQANQSAWEFKRRMMAMVRSVETAYWQLYAAQLNLRAVEEALPLYSEVVRVEESRLRVNAAVPADVAQAQSDFYELRGQRLAALANVAAQQALLRNLLGLPPTDGRQIVLRDMPMRAPVVLDWDQTVNIALERRPDIIRQRLAVHVRELQILIARNGLLPQVNGEFLHRINGLGDDLDGSLSQLGDNQFQDWRMGVSLVAPIGNHVAKAQMRSAQLSLLREQALLRQAAHIATHQLADIVRNIDWSYQQYEVAARRSSANNEWQRGARARFTTPAGGVSLLQALDIYLRSIRSAVSANQNTANLIAQYNIALVQLEEAKGTLLANHEIYLFNDPCTAVQKVCVGAQRAGEDIIDRNIPSPIPARPEPAVPVQPSPSDLPPPGTTTPSTPGAGGPIPQHVVSAPGPRFAPPVMPIVVPVQPGSPAKAPATAAVSPAVPSGPAPTRVTLPPTLEMKLVTPAAPQLSPGRSPAMAGPSSQIASKPGMALSNQTSSPLKTSSQGASTAPGGKSGSETFPGRSLFDVHPEAQLKLGVPSNKSTITTRVSTRITDKTEFKLSTTKSTAANTAKVEGSNTKTSDSKSSSVKVQDADRPAETEKAAATLKVKSIETESAEVKSPVNKLRVSLEAGANSNATTRVRWDSVE